MPGPSIPLMPMARVAADAQGAPSVIPPIPPMAGGPGPTPPAGALPPPAAPEAMNPPGMFPPPQAPAAPPFNVRMQPDGSSVYIIPSPDGDPGKDIVLGINPPPKLPKAFQPPAQPGA